MHLHVGMHRHIHILRLCLGIDCFLAGIEAVVSGQGKADRNHDGKAGHRHIPEHLQSDDKCGDGRIGHAHKDGQHATGCTELRLQAQDLSEEAAEAGADGKGGHNLASLVSGLQRHRGKENLQQKCQGISLPQLDGLVNHRRTGSVIITGGEELPGATLTLSDASSKTLGMDFYCCPNPEGKTRLVLELTVCGIKNYYPVTLPPMQCNYEYRIADVELTGWGSASPDVPVDRERLCWNLSVLPWGQEGKTFVMN